MCSAASRSFSGIVPEVLRALVSVPREEHPIIRVAPPVRRLGVRCIRPAVRRRVDLLAPVHRWADVRAFLLVPALALVLAPAELAA